MTVTAFSRPSLWRRARLDFDPVRNRPMLVYPEGVMFLNATGAAIVELFDGERTVADIASILGARYEADVLADVIEFVGELVTHEMVRDAAAAAGEG